MIQCINKSHILKEIFFHDFFLQKFKILSIVSKKGAQVGWQSAGHSNRNRGLNYFCTYMTLILIVLLRINYFFQLPTNVLAQLYLALDY
jgi:hypothetical protein